MKIDRNALQKLLDVALERGKNLFKKGALNLDVVTESGEMLVIASSGETPAVGDAVTIKDTGNAPNDGPHKLQDGTEIYVIAGKIATPPTADDMEIKEVEALGLGDNVTPEDKKKIAEAMKKNKEAYNALQSENNALNNDYEALAEKALNLGRMIESLPAEFSTAQNNAYAQYDKNTENVDSITKKVIEDIRKKNSGK